MLKIRFKDNKNNAVWLVEPKITIGRSATNALVVDDPEVSDVHLEILVNHEALTLRNLVPSSPVRVNTIEVSGACALKPDDQVSIGNVDLVVVDPKREAKSAADLDLVPSKADKPTGWSLKSNHAALASRVFPLKNQTVVGRSSECDICLSAAHLSRRHAQLQVTDGMLFVRDLGSANGTFVNGKQITEIRLKRGDELRFDSLSFGVIGPADEMNQTTVRKLDVKVEAAQAQVARSAAMTHSVPTATLASSSNPNVATRPLPANASNKGKYGLLVLTVLALIVIIALYLTRK